MYLKKIALTSTLIVATTCIALAGSGSYSYSGNSFPGNYSNSGSSYSSGKSGSYGGNSYGSSKSSSTSSDVDSSGSESFVDNLENSLKPIWDLGKLYKSDDGFLRALSIGGRYQGQYFWADGTGGSDDDYETRRSRLGIKAKFAGGFEFKATWNVELDDDLAFSNLDSGGLFWKGDGIYAGVGKLKPKITAEYSTSSKKILTFERSLLVNQVTPSKTSGVVIGGIAGDLKWDLYGLFGGREGEQRLPTTDGGFNALVRLAHPITENTTGHLHYLWHNADEENSNFEDYDNLISLGSTTKMENGGLVTDLIYGTGEEDTADVFGVVVMPYYDLTDRLRFVIRGQYATANGDEGLRLQSRYERRVDDGDRGDSYWAVYAGLNYYIMGDKLKIMNGFEYSDLSGADNYDGWTYFTGLRMYF